MRLLGSFLLLCSLVTPAWAILGIGDAVYDAAVHFDTTLTASRELIQIYNQIQDLASLTEMASFLDTVQDATDLINGIQAFAGPLVQRYGRWAEYIGQASTRCNIYQVNAWVRAYDQESAAAFTDAATAKPLFTNATQSLRTLVQTIQQVLGLNGTVKGLQTLNGLVGSLLTRTVAMEAANTSFHETVQRKEVKEFLEDQAANALLRAQRMALRGVKMCQ